MKVSAELRRPYEGRCRNTSCSTQSGSLVKCQVCCSQCVITCCLLSAVSDFSADRLPQQLKLSAVMLEVWQTFDASPVMSGQLLQQQNILSDAFSVVLQARCFHDCSTCQIPCQLCHRPDVFVVVPYDTRLLSCLQCQNCRQSSNTYQYWQLAPAVRCFNRCSLQPSAASDLEHIPF